MGPFRSCNIIDVNPLDLLFRVHVTGAFQLLCTQTCEPPQATDSREWRCFQGLTTEIQTVKTGASEAIRQSSSVARPRDDGEAVLLTFFGAVQ